VESGGGTRNTLYFGYKLNLPNTPLACALQNAIPKNTYKASGGNLGSKVNESNVDIVVFGHEQDGVGVSEGEHWEMDQRDWLGYKKRTGKLDANLSLVDSIVFGHDQDGHSSMKQFEEELMQLPQFKGAAGMPSSEVTASNVLQDPKIVPSKFTKLKNSSDVDMVVFGHDQDGSGAGPNQDMEDLEASPLFFGSAGVHTTDASLKEAVMWYGGPKGRATTALQHTASSTDQSFQTMQEGPGAPQAKFKESKPFIGAAGDVGTPSATPANTDGTIAWASRKVNRPNDTMQDDFAAGYLDFRTERGADAAELPILAQEHNHGSIKAVVFSGPDPVGNRDALGVGKISKDSTLLEKREASRRSMVAHGCRSQAYQKESEFNGAAGLGSDEIFFANTADLVRRVKPVTRKAGYSGVTDVDMVVFGHDLEGNGDKDGTSMLKEAVFAGSAGASSAQVHAFTSCSRSAPRDVPQMRDQMDNIVFGHEMQDTPSQMKQEELFFELQRGSAGSASVEIGSRSFDARLEKSSAEGGPEFAWGTLGNRHVEPRGDLTSGIPNNVGGADYPPPYLNACGAPRDMLARKEMESRFTVNSNGGEVKVRYRNDLDSKDARSVLEENYHPEKQTSYGSLKASVHVTPDEKIEGAAGKASRMINDYNAGPFTWVDADTEEERRLSEFNAGSQAVAEVLEGDGYLSRDTDPLAKLIPDEYNAVKGRKVSPEVAAQYKAQRELVKGDSIAKMNLLKPDLNFAALDLDGDGVIEENEMKAAGGLQGDVFVDKKNAFEEMMQQKTFGQPKPFGTDPLDAWYCKPNYMSVSKADAKDVRDRLDDLRSKHQKVEPPQQTAAEQRRKPFLPAREAHAQLHGVDYKGGHQHTHLKYGETKPEKVNVPILQGLPFGTDPTPPGWPKGDFPSKYETASLAGPGSWDQSLASRIARRRVFKAQNSPRLTKSAPTTVRQPSEFTPNRAGTRQ